MPASPDRIAFIRSPFRRAVVEDPAIRARHGQLARESDDPVETYFDYVSNAEVVAKERQNLLAPERRRFSVRTVGLDEALALDFTGTGIIPAARYLDTERNCDRASAIVSVTIDLATQQAVLGCYTLNANTLPVDITPPSIETASAVTVPENTVFAHNLRASEPVTWSIAGGADAAQFEIVGSTLIFASGVAKDRETPTDSNGDNVYEVIVRATDTANLFVDLAMTVTVTNVLEAQTLGELGGVFALREDANQGDLAGTITGRTPGSLLEIVDDAGGVVTISGIEVRRGGTALDYEGAVSHTFLVRETLADSPNSPRETWLTLRVSDVIEPEVRNLVILGEADGTQNLTASYDLIGDTPVVVVKWYHVETGVLLGQGNTLSASAISGLPNSNYIDVNVEATNNAGFDSQWQRIQVTGGVYGPPVIVSASPPAQAYIGVNYSHTFEAESGNPPYTVTIEYEDGSPAVLPPGMAIAGMDLAGAIEEHPALSGAFDNETGQTTASIGATTNKADAVLHYWVGTSATISGATDEARIANLKAGVGATKFGTKSVAAAGQYTETITGLSPSTPYFTHFVFSKGGHDSPIASADGFTTQAFVAPTANYAFDPDAGSYRQNAAATGTTGTTYTSPASMAGHSFTAPGAIQELDSANNLVPFAADEPAITDEGFWSRQTLTNWMPRTGPTSSQLGSATHVSNVTAPAGFPFAAWIALDNSTAIANATQNFTPNGNKPYTMVVYVETPDGSQPVVRNDNNNGGDFRFRVGGYPTGTFYYDRCGTSNVWRVVGHFTTATAPTSSVGIRRELGQNSRVLKFSGFHMFDGHLLDPPVVRTTGTNATRGESLLAHNIFANGAALPNQDMMIFARATPYEVQTVALCLENALGSDNIVLDFGGLSGDPRPQAYVYVGGTQVYFAQHATGITPRTPAVLGIRRLGGAWRAGFYLGGTWTWLDAGAAGAMAAVTKSTPGNFGGGGYPLQGLLHTAKIFPGTFSTDAAVIAAAGSV